MHFFAYLSFVFLMTDRPVEGLLSAIPLKSDSLIQDPETLLSDSIFKALFQKYFFLESLNVQLNLEIRLRPWSYSLSFKEANIGLEMKDSMFFEVAQKKNYLDQFIPNISVGAPGSRIFANIFYETTLNSIAANLNFESPEMGNLIPIQLITQRLGVFHFKVKEIGVLTAVPKKSSDAMIFPILFNLSDDSLGQPLDGLIFIWKKENQEEWFYRFLLFARDPSISLTEILSRINAEQISLHDWIPMDCIEDQECSIARLQSLDLSEKGRENSQLLKGLMGQALFLIDGSFSNPKKERLLIHLVLDPQEDRFALPTHLRLQARVQNDNLMHFVYQNFDHSRSEVILDFLKRDQTGVHRGSARVEWRPFEDLERSNQRAPFVWRLGRGLGKVFDLPLAEMSAWALRFRGDRFVLRMNRGELWRDGKKIKERSFKRTSPPKR